MITSPRVVRVGTRASRLARTQTELVRRMLAERHHAIEFQDVIISTEGDRDGHTPLPEIGGKGVFTEELEAALRDEAIDVAVHSLKDVPVESTAGLVLGAIGMREDPRDVLISALGWTLDTLPRGAAVGTCSTRRAAQLLATRPDLRLLPLRGNVDSRVGKARAGEYDAIVLAAAGVHRLGLAAVISEYLPLEVMLPAPGQGALAVQCRSDDAGTLQRVRGLDDATTRSATEAERSFLEGLGGGCAAPIAAYGQIQRGRLHLRGMVVSSDGRREIRLVTDGPPEEGRRLGLALADEARAKGAEALLA